jgi:hypothetical protein
MDKSDSQQGESEVRRGLYGVGSQQRVAMAPPAGSQVGSRGEAAKACQAARPRHMRPAQMRDGRGATGLNCWLGRKLLGLGK